MTDWVINEQNQTEFAGGKEAWEKAAEIAERCEFFILDVEDELASDIDRSCYNCRFRRWTMNSFTCMYKRR